MTKTWETQDYFNEYLDLKVDISERIKNLKFIKTIGTVTEEGIQSREEMLNEKIERFKFVLQQLKFCGIDFQDLILLSLGVEVDLIK